VQLEEVFPTVTVIGLEEDQQTAVDEAFGEPIDAFQHHFAWLYFVLG
jgi:hypothetical protein